MAAVSLSPMPQNLAGMSSRRVPLGNVPNAANSPFRAVAAAASKRSRQQVEAQEELPCDPQPRAKRQMVENVRATHKASPRRQPFQSAEGRVFDKQSGTSQPTEFQKKLLAARDERSRQRVEKQEKATSTQMDEVRQWQKHYKKLFPSFVFYFESLPEDVRTGCSKNVKSLGAREEKFFSREVTHVVTARPIPIDSDPKDATTSSASMSSQQSYLSRTVDPSCLERYPENQGQQNQSRSRLLLEASTNKRLPSNARDTEPRKGPTNADILLRAREMGMKVWSLEKLQRAVRTMLELPNESRPQPGNLSRTKITLNSLRASREADLSRMLKDERINGPSDRDLNTSLDELTYFKGHHIYVRDMDERTKPILVRDYPKPVGDEDSEWPQFHSVGSGKCPFVPEAEPPTRQEFERAKAREEESRAQTKAQGCAGPRTRAATVRGDAETDTTKNIRQKRPLEELRDGGNATMQQQAKMPSKEFCPPPPRNERRSPTKVPKEGPTNIGRLFGGEPAASGMQPSNITSAIRSQMISSTAAAPGAKAGLSKEVHGLKRKVLEKNAGPVMTNVQTRQRSVEAAGNGRAESMIAAARQTRRQKYEPLIHIDEERTQSEDDEDVWLAEEARSKSKQLQKASEKKNARPGYCENCKEKYDDFDDHIVGRKHRKFALTPENWRDLDRLLSHLGRRLKGASDSEGF